MDNIRVQIRIPEDILADLDRLADAHGITRSAMIRLLIKRAANGAGTTTRPIEDH